MWWVVDNGGFVLGFFLLWVVAATMVVVVADGGCFGFFAVGYGYHGGASGGFSLWVFGGLICVFFFPLVVVAGYRGWWQWMWVLIGVMAIM